MAQPERRIQYEDEEIQADLLLRRADVRMGMKRSRLKEGSGWREEPDPDLQILRLFTYPDLVAATVSGRISRRIQEEWQPLSWPLSFDDFLSLPEPFASAWENACYALNGHWLPKPPEEKKASTGQPATNSTAG
jgi:hypothetical protein